MVRIECCLLLAFCLVQLALTDDRPAAETERLRNTPPELSAAASGKSSAQASPGNGVGDGQAQARFIPFAASFSLSAGGGAAQTFSIAGSPDGIGISQSASQTNAANGNLGSFTASQSSSLAAGLNGISASESNSFAANHPSYGPTAQSSGNSFALGQASASSHGDVVNGQALSGAQSSAGGAHSQASSLAAASAGAPQQISTQHRPGWNNAQPSYGSGNNGDYYHNSRGTPGLTITVSDGHQRPGKSQPSNGWYEVKEPRDLCKSYTGWYRDPRCRGPRVTVTKPGGSVGSQRPYFESSNRDPRQEGPSVHISSATAGSSAQSRPGGLAVGQSSAQSSQGNRRPTSLTINQVQTSGNAQAHAHGSAGSVNQPHHHHNHNRQPGGGLQASLSSGSASASSRPGGFAQGSSQASSTAGGSANSQASGNSIGGGSAHAAANAGAVVFPGPSTGAQIIPKEFVRSNNRAREDGPLDEFITDLTDTVYEILDY